MAISLVYLAVYVLLLGVASFLERPVGHSVQPFQLNVLIRAGGAAVGITVLLVIHGLALPTALPLLTGLGIGALAGVGSICYCLALDSLAVSVVVTCANLYIVVTVLLGIVILHETITLLKIASLILTLTGVLALSYTPGRFGVQQDEGRGKIGKTARNVALLAAYVIVIGISTFLEKPALRALDATQLNALEATGMVIVACIAVGLRDGLPRPPGRALEGTAIGAMIGLGSIFYFLGLRQLPVSVAAAVSNAYMLVTVVLSVVFLHHVLPWPKWVGIALTAIGVTLLAYSAG